MTPCILLWKFYADYDNSSPPGQNGRYFTEENFLCIVVNEKLCILIKLSLKFAPKVPTDNNTALI